MPERGPAARFAATRFDTAGRGYDQEQVDPFLAQLATKIRELQDLLLATEAHTADVEAQLNAAGQDLSAMPADHGPLTPRAGTSALLDELQFAETRNGYEMAQVDEFLHELGLEIAELQGRYQRARERRASADMRLALLSGDVSDD